MTHKGKHLWLCECCDEHFSCQKPCESALKFQADRPDKEGRSADKYKPIGMSHTWLQQKGK